MMLSLVVLLLVGLYTTEISASFLPECETYHGRSWDFVDVECLTKGTPFTRATKYKETKTLKTVGATKPWCIDLCKDRAKKTAPGSGFKNHEECVSITFDNTNNICFMNIREKCVQGDFVDVECLSKGKLFTREILKSDKRQVKKTNNKLQCVKRCKKVAKIHMRVCVSITFDNTNKMCTMSTRKKLIDPIDPLEGIPDNCKERLESAPNVLSTVVSVGMKCLEQDDGETFKSDEVDYGYFKEETTAGIKECISECQHTEVGEECVFIRFGEQSKKCGLYKKKKKDCKGGQIYYGLIPCDVHSSEEGREPWTCDDVLAKADGKMSYRLCNRNFQPGCGCPIDKPVMLRGQCVEEDDCPTNCVSYPRFTIKDKDGEQLTEVTVKADEFACPKCVCKIKQGYAELWDGCNTCYCVDNIKVALSKSGSNCPGALT